MGGNHAKVLMTDAGYRNALAALQSLGRRGIPVVMAGPDSRGYAFHSRYCRGLGVYTHPARSVEGFVSDLIRLLRLGSCEVLIPISMNSTIPVSLYKNRLLKYAKVPVADYKVVEMAQDKMKTLRIAEEIGISTPKTITPEGLREVKRIAKDLDYPVIIKTRRGAGSLRDVRKANTPKELIQKYAELESLSNATSNYLLEDYRRPMIQEFVPGEIYDVCVLFNEGEARAALAQRRVITFPLGGGFGIVNETVRDFRLIKLALRLLESMNWHGVAQVEFRLDADGKPKLMEVNPKFWGTLELSIKAGIDFPHLLYKMAIDGDVDPTFRYREGIQFWWVSSNLHMLLVAFLQKHRNVLSALLSRGVKTCDIHLDDIVPVYLKIVKNLRKLLLGGRAVFSDSYIL